MTHRNEIADATSERAKDYEKAKVEKRRNIAALSFHAYQVLKSCEATYWTKEKFHRDCLDQSIQGMLTYVHSLGDIPGDFVVIRRDDLARMVSDKVEGRE